ncbi:LOB domain-containing protein 36 [Apostasia shenzhenica]|uniref:LOB domain-containing protein 36 n=1 Tax=Apostasia shenzhenica TaxID=1088818 RepID=A0A2I0BDS1_9ASPA|nr:LOB domain-containing protein 36 [Apostasia shenzhenica]
MSSSSSPCAACKLLRRKCTQGCVFAPYFPPDQPHKFSNVHRVFGASNVAKLLNDLQPAQREDAVNSLAYEADARLQDPVYGCVGYISVLQHRLQQLQRDLFLAKKELSAYIGPAALGPIFPQFHGGPISPAAAAAAAAAAAHPAIPVQGMGLGLGANLPSASSSPAMLRDHYHHHQSQQEIEAAQQLAAAVAAAREQEIMLRSIEQQQEMARLISGGGNVVGVLPPPPPAVQAPNISGFEGSYIAQQQQQQQQQNEVIKFEETHLHHHHHQRKGSDDERSGGGPPPSRSSS